MSGSTFTVRCQGCNAQETHPWTGLSNGEYEKTKADMATRGWMRRDFGPGACVDFCSEDCAYNSWWAKECEEWWAKQDEEKRQKEFERYCNEETGPSGTAILIGIGVLLGALLLGMCFYA